MMRRLATALLLAGLGCQAECRSNSTMVYDFDQIKPSAKLTWTPCFDDFTCTRLQLPLDYANRDLGTTSIAFIKLAGKNATAESQSIVIIPGGPGGSGIDIVRSTQAALGPMLGESYNFVSFDPRGVEASGPKLDCFSGNEEARSAFLKLHYTGITNTSSSSLQQQFYSASMYGEWCNDAVTKGSLHGYYMTTPAVAHDLLTFAEAEAELAGQPVSEAKLWSYGISYGTVIGTTFASMFPDRVGRMVLESVVDPDEYYNNDWRSNNDDADKAFERFSTFCHAAGPDLCAFWGPTPANITAKMDNVIRQLESHPIPISGVQEQTPPTLVTYSDLKAFLSDGIYTPLSFFPIMAEVLDQLQRGNATGLVGRVDRMGNFSDEHVVIRCVDSYRNNNLTTVEEFKGFVDDSVSKSRYIGDIFPLLARTVLCQSIRPDLPDSMVVQGQVSGLDKPPAFPILFTSSTIDPITPSKLAHKMSARFPGSVVLLQEAVGHPVVWQGGSPCYFGHIQGYLQGVMPPSNVTCPQVYVPFVDDPIF